MCVFLPRLERQLFVESMFRNKAVADGAVSFCIDHYATARVSKFVFGTGCCILYDAKHPEHASGSDKYVDLPGDVMIGDVFSNILPMVMWLFDGILSC